MPPQYNVVCAIHAAAARAILRGPMFRFIAFILLAAMLHSQSTPRLLVTGWRIEPAGSQTPLGDFPTAAALSPDGKYLVALNAGSAAPSLSVMDTASGRVTATVPVPDAWLGIVFSPKGDRLYVGGAARAAIFEFAFAAGKLTPARTFNVVAPDKRTAADFIGDVASSRERPPALRRRPVSRFCGGRQSADRAW